MSLSKVILALVATTGFAAQPCVEASNTIQGVGEVPKTMVIAELQVRTPIGAAASAKPIAAVKAKGTTETASLVPIVPMALSRLTGKTTVMLQAGQILAWLSALLLLAAFLAWFKPRGRPLGQHRSRADPILTSGDTAPRLLLSAVGLSTVAAILAVSGCVFK